jgi:TIGR00010: hydrolase, TatD family
VRNCQQCGWPWNGKNLHWICRKIWFYVCRSRISSRKSRKYSGQLSWTACTAFKT